MNQSSVIAGALVLAFAIFVVVRGELPCYLAVLGVSSGAGCPLGTVSSSGITSTGAGPTTGDPKTPTLPPPRSGTVGFA
jgi:hypothetical protein